MITKRIVCISGFQQDISTPTGIESLWMKLRDLHQSKECAVCLHPWNYKWAGFADHILRTGPEDPREMDIRIAAYSWGAGSASIRFAKALKDRGMSIEIAVFSDPVYHSWWGLWRSLWSPLLGKPVVKIPKNVRNVWYVRQQRFPPFGHECVPEDYGATQVKDYGMLDRPHAWIDNAVEFHDLAMRAMLHVRGEVHHVSEQNKRNLGEKGA